MANKTAGTGKYKTTKPKATQKNAGIRKPSTVKKATKHVKGKKATDSSPLRRIPYYILGILVAIAVGLVTYIACRVVIDNAFIIKAKFGEIVYPDGEIRGIDISHYQAEIDWDKLRNAEINGVPIRFILIKATEGTDIIDENFNENFAKAHKNGFLRGAYHFFSTQSNPISQAKHFCRIAQLEGYDILPILDVERIDNLTPQHLRENVIKWMNYVEQHYGVPPILYTSYSFRIHYLNTPEFDRYPFWIAHYYVEELTYKGEWKFWQHSDRGEIDGITGNVDINVFNGTYEELQKLTIVEYKKKLHGVESLDEDLKNGYEENVRSITQ